MSSDLDERARSTDVAGVAKAFWRRYRDEGVEAALGVVVEDVRWCPHDLDVDLCGHDAVRAYCSGLEAAGNRLELFPYVFEPIGSAVLVAGVLRVRGPDGWRDLPRWWVHEIDEGHVSALRGYDSRERALAAAERPR